MIGHLVFAASLATGASNVPIVIVSREEIRDGVTYEVFLAPPCMEKRPICEPWEREWTDAIKMHPGDIVTPEGLILREKKNA